MQRTNQIILIIGLAGVVWPMMMLVHESGHVLGALLTGGHVQRMVWYPLVFSRTDVNPNPWPLIVVWAGPAFGAIAPLIASICVSAIRSSIAYLVQFFAGFCLLANGAYIGVGAFEHVGDAHDMLRLGSPVWLMVVFGIITVLPGFWLWHRIGEKLGFGKQPQTIRRKHAYGVLALAILIGAIGFLAGNPG